MFWVFIKQLGVDSYKPYNDIIALFKEEWLSITIEKYLIESDSLDVTFNLLTEKYFRFRKTNNTPLYINALSNHPSIIIKQVPKKIIKRISDFSCIKKEFDKVKSIKKTPLNDSRHFSSMLWMVISFNPPYS